MEAIIFDKPADPDEAIIWTNDYLLLLDQRKLPTQECYLPLNNAAETADAIRDMVVRGAPAIGITAAYGVVLSARGHYRQAPSNWREPVAADIKRLAAARPTAVNLFWALDRMRAVIDALAEDDPFPRLLAEAIGIHEADAEANRTMGSLGAELIGDATNVITHCNAGALATGGHGTALGVIRSAFAQGKISRVYADETRPWLQGARLTAWELQHDAIPVSLMVEGAAAARMARGDIGWVIVGSDRIAANGDVANKVGTYGLAVLARQHGVRFMVAAPTSTVDMQVATGAQIPIEERDPAEVLQCGGHQVGAAGVDAWNPVFDVTPARLVDAIVTEKGVVLNPNSERMARMMAD